MTPTKACCGDPTQDAELDECCKGDVVDDCCKGDGEVIDECCKGEEVDECCKTKEVDACCKGQTAENEVVRPPAACCSGNAESGAPAYECCEDDAKSTDSCCDDCCTPAPAPNVSVLTSCCAAVTPKREPNAQNCCTSAQVMDDCCADSTQPCALDAKPHTDDCVPAPGKACCDLEATRGSSIDRWCADSIVIECVDTCCGSGHSGEEKEKEASIHVNQLPCRVLTRSSSKCSSNSECSRPQLRRRTTRTTRKRCFRAPSLTTFGRFFDVACCLQPSNPSPPPPITTPVVVGKGKPRVKKHIPIVQNVNAQSVDMVERGDLHQRKIMTMTVEGMDCPSCASRVTKALLTLPSVSDPKVNAFSGQATLMYADAAIPPEEIAKRITTMTGFQCTALLRSSNDHQQRALRLRVDATSGVSDKVEVPALPLGITVKSVQHENDGSSLINLEYDPGVIQPRAVIDAFASWHGVHLPQDPVAHIDQASKDLVALLYRTIISIVCCIPVLIFAWAPIPPHFIAYGASSVALTSIIQLYVAAPMYSSALRSLIYQRIIDMDLLVVMSTTTAYVFSLFAFAFAAAGHPFSDQFFETSALLVTLIMVGRLVSAYARRIASSALGSLGSLTVETVDLILERSTAVVPISAELVHVNDILRIRPDSRIPTDGVVVRGATEVDEASITGESAPVIKKKGTALIAGTLNLSGTLDMAVTRAPGDNTVADIKRLMMDAQDSRLPVQDLADSVAAWLAPVVLGLSVATFLVWLGVGLGVRHHIGRTAAVDALMYAIAVMVVSCPCAIALAIPMVVVIAVSVAAKHGVLWKSVSVVQIARDVSVVVFDKTGTLTRGDLSVVRSHLLHADAAPILLELLSSSSHPVAKALTAHLTETTVKHDSPPVIIQLAEEIRSILGNGTETRFRGLALRGGNPKWLGLELDPIVHSLRSEKLTIFAAKLGSETIAIFGLADTLRHDAIQCVQSLQYRIRPVDVYIVSGDDQSVVNAVGSQLGVDPDHVFGNCLPQAKQDHVKRLQRGGAAKVMFVGDGTNDSLALVQSDVGVSFGSGTDVAVSAADVVILNASDLARSVSLIISISEAVVLRIKGNFIWSFVYNMFAILLAGGAFVKGRIAPQYAGLGEIVSVLPVVLVAWTMWLARV